MAGTKRWTVEIIIDEHEGRTFAEATLYTGDAPPLTGTGRARLSPDDDDIPEIGDEVAVARALNALGERLRRTTAEDIASVTREPVRLHR
ncbi:hypothetical protein Val02_49920 [Virgisporangium aliadipatigenens]|uniref:DUF1876 domain-containing protein n=1 Tax=Virgisporangium aliadipatigenens TaxID=741659 RepID=A0A8J3YMR1_9ACTN|nr:DUF1876 domain-containing protein [Virgisporangium aliadipatigenens]GIJ48106.1 hypothetical protein Val02_49920 [Virgisporangium aliadipatigenens]